MKRCMTCLVLTVVTSIVAGGTAMADITSLRISFAGGCSSENITGSCLIKTLASGSDLDAEQLDLYVSDGPKAPLQRASMHHSRLNASGVGRSRVRNRLGGCYQMRTAANGNDVPDVKSNLICESSPVALPKPQSR